MAYRGWCARAAVAAALAASLAGCSVNNAGVGKVEDEPVASAAPTVAAAVKEAAAEPVDEQPGTVYYEIFVRSFYDSNGDGIGDLNGVTAKLDYLQQLGVGGIWLMPINPSPSYHGYDVTDYRAVNPDYGTLEDLKKLTVEAHKRGIKVIQDLVVNHTSTEHPWFKEALADPDSPYRSWYHFAGADEDAKADGAVGSNPWHLAADGKSKYLGVFWEGMPDLDFDNADVRQELASIGQYWLEQGLDGFRLDAAKHIYGDYASTINSAGIQAANQKWWQEFRSGLSDVKPDAYLVGEVWDSPVVIAPYLDKGLDSAFDFDLAGKLISAADRERDSDLAFTLGKAYGLYEKSSGGTYVDAPFLSNHDQTRVMTALNGNLAHAKMAAAMLLTLPGNPFIYYGEEIGMAGAKPDEYLREPMVWYASPEGGEGQTNWEQSKYNVAGSAVSVESEQRDAQSLLAWYRMLLKWRSEEPALRDGGIAAYSLKNAVPQVSAYVRATADERVLVLHNLSGQPQKAELAGEFGSFAELSRKSDNAAELSGGGVTLPPYSSVILK
ncbi:alpha-amylase family glycosyl hydrolase [Paenibacillus sp. JDR-2]|uniref:alpha-amylase family glycosyl hydrolase n=1 Tax=Paenibacillus sp. (strain JDR-2) TaxID=324057 RepID=UPI000166B119|nr:alpha-amylase family glycosyl hydrolase [Paenibacillus sp. JDR-2]ACS99453.1 alpha amylase catalytic region [Paenibacillus sp. JDR-2]